MGDVFTPHGNRDSHFKDRKGKQALLAEYPKLTKYRSQISEDNNNDENVFDNM